MKKLSLLYFLTLCLFYTNHSFSQSKLGTWNIVTVKIPLTEKWSVFGEAQLRSLKFYDHFHYYEYKAGIQYKLDKQFSLAAGVGNFDTYASGDDFKTPMANDETRSWLQLNMNQYFQHLKFEHRYRAEQRWTTFGFRNRFRYRLGVTMPFKKQKIEPKTLYVYAWDEIFFTNHAPYFERNRFSAGGGYVLSNQFSLQLGWVNQFDYRINDETGKNFLQLSVLIEMARKKTAPEKVPGAIE